MDNTIEFSEKTLVYRIDKIVNAFNSITDNDIEQMVKSNYNYQKECIKRYAKNKSIPAGDIDKIVIDIDTDDIVAEIVAKIIANCDIHYGSMIYLIKQLILNVNDNNHIPKRHT